jgi:hypothetical protein
LIGLGHLNDPFPKLCNYLSAILVWFGYTVGELTYFSLLRLFIFSSFWIRSGNNLPL